MDTRTLVTILVTAIITAFVKEIVGALLSTLKNIVTSTTVKARIKSALTANRIIITVNLLTMFFCAWQVYSYATLPDPLTSWTVFNIAYFTCAGFANLLRAEFQLAISRAQTHERELRAEIEAQVNKRHMDNLALLEEAVNKLNTSLDRPSPRKEIETTYPDSER